MFRIGPPSSHRQLRLTATASAAALMASVPLGTVLETWTWFTNAVLMTVGLCATALALRAVRAPAWVVPVGMAAAVPALLCLMFPSGSEVLRVIPTGASLRWFADLATTAVSDLNRFSSPAPARPGFVFLATLGVAGVTIMVDTFAVGLRKPAVAGLPMLALYSVPVAARNDHVSIIPFVVGACGFLWMLVTDSVDRVRRFGRRFSGDGRSLDVWESSPLTTAGQGLSILGIVLAVAVPVALPGLHSGLLDELVTGSGRGGGTPAGSDATVGLYATMSGHLRRDRSFDMVRVTTDDPDPYYLRYAVADQLTMSGFRSRPVSGGLPLAGGVAEPGPPRLGVVYHRHQAKIDILNLKSSLLPVYQQPTSADQLDRSWLYESSTSVVHSRSRDTRKMSYGFQYTRLDFTPEALRTAPALSASDSIKPEVLAVPRVDEVAKLVDQLVNRSAPEYDQVTAIFKYFAASNGFVYDVRTAQGSSGKEIVDFLTQKRGYCAQYSGAMAWLVRQAGFPARVAFGFSRGGGTPGTPVVLTNFNLHAWTEVYFPGFGWVPFDPTPASNVPGSANPAWAPNPGASQLDPSAAPSASTPAGTGPSAAAGGPAPAPDQQQQRGPSAGTDAPQAQTPLWPLGVGLSLLGLSMALAAPAWRRRVRRGQRLRPLARRGEEPAPGTGDPPPCASSPGAASPGVASQGQSRPGDMVTVPAADPHTLRRDAHAAWDELLDTLVDFGIPLRESETPRATAERLAALGLPDAVGDGARRLGRVEEHARYSAAPVAEAGLPDALRSIREALSAQVPSRVRLRARVFPPSVIRSWKAEVSRRWAGLAVGIQQLGGSARVATDRAIGALARVRG